MNAKRVVIAGNWKMNHGPRETGAFFEELAGRWSEHVSESTTQALSEEKMQILLFPPMVSLSCAIEARGNLPVQIGSQNTHFENQGAFTGEVSASMLNEIGVTCSLVGHSERRQYFGETHESAGKRLRSLLTQKVQTVFCVGETRQEREAGSTWKVLESQLQAAFPKAKILEIQASITAGLLQIAHEPVWAIGTGLTATPAQAEEAHQWIDQWLMKNLGAELTRAIPLLYGGSVTPANIHELLQCPHVDGALVGGASLKTDSFIQLIEAGGQKVQSARSSSK